MKINASPPTTYVVILLNLRSVAAFTVESFRSEFTANL